MIIGSLLFIFDINLWIGILMVVFIIPAVLFFRYFYGREKRLIKLVNSSYESQVDKLQTNDFNIIGIYFERRRNLYIRQSTLNAMNWATFDILTNLFLLISIMIYVTYNTMTAGEVISFYSYLRNYLGSTLSLSFAMTTYARLQDISKRLL